MLDWLIDLLAALVLAGAAVVAPAKPDHALFNDCDFAGFNEVLFLATGEEIHYVVECPEG